jgi:hypothetical protein
MTPILEKLIEILENLGGLIHGHVPVSGSVCF